MNTKHIFSFFLALMVALLAGCNEGELAFDVIESPVLAVFEDVDTGTPGVVAVSATFYELDKSGILDKNIGIDSIPLTSLNLSVFVNESTLIEDVSTDGLGKVYFEKSVTELGGASRLEWVGEYKQVPFRIYKNF